MWKCNLTKSLINIRLVVWLLQWLTAHWHMEASKDVQVLTEIHTFILLHCLLSPINSPRTYKWTTPFATPHILQFLYTKNWPLFSFYLSVNSPFSQLLQVLLEACSGLRGSVGQSIAHGIVTVLQKRRDCPAKYKDDKGCYPGKIKCPSFQHIWTRWSFKGSKTFYWGRETIEEDEGGASSQKQSSS